MTTSTPNRQSTYSPGPRPLQLAQHSSSTPVSPSTAQYASPLPRSDSTSAWSFSTPRRQSSISYYSPSESEKRSSLGVRPSRHALARSLSVGTGSYRGGDIDGRVDRDRRSLGAASESSVTGPHTLAEKHADLLHFIAQKESKCLELRSQLAVHETELLQLKRKWERIVNRGFERSNGIALADSTSPSPLSSSPVSNTLANTGTAQIQGGAMLEGIREGVQGVSRLIAAGLGELSTASGSVAPAPATTNISTTPTPISAARISRTHSTHPSNSSASTYATSGTGTSMRLSQSSASSLGVDDGTDGDLFGEFKQGVETEGGKDQEEQVLMVHDTGATPTMSPNPAFEHMHHSGPGALSGATKLHRRKSQNSSPPTTLSLSLSDSPTKGTGKGGLRPKRGVGTGLPPAASIPVGVLTAGLGAGGAGSWVGSVGKKWEEIQKGATFTKSQKRASVLLSGMSSTIASALSSPPLTSASYSPSSLSAPFSFHSQSHTPESVTPLHSGSSSVSLLDDDDTVHSALGAVMTPTPTSTTSAAASAGKEVDVDEEWGW